MYKKRKFVCLSVLYAFGHGTSKCNQILQSILFCSERGQGLHFVSKFLLCNTLSSNPIRGALQYVLAELMKM